MADGFALHLLRRGAASMKGLVIAAQFLTRLPTPRIAVSGEEFAASMRWFPAAGLLIGAIVAGCTWAGAWIDPWLGALAGLIAWVAVTGALHLDGLGDVADAAGAAHKDRDRLLAVLADPHVGSFAVVTVSLQLAAKLILLQLLAAQGQFLPLALIPCAARIGPLAWTCWLPSLHDGLAARFRRPGRSRDLVVWTAALLAASLLVPALLADLLLVPLWVWHIRRTLGGISGDGHGAGIELVESGLLLAALLTARLA
jgi:adenosylcobinamide-GDP ribazoletransferase